MKFDQLSTGGVVTDAVSGNNLTVKHVTQPGFTTSDPSLTLQVIENASSGSVVGSVTGTDIDREANITSLLAADPTLRYSAETGKFYKLVSTYATWVSSQTTAIGTTLGGIAGQLLTIDNAAENEFARTLASEVGDNVWLGFSDQIIEGDFQKYTGNTAGNVIYRGTSTGYNVDGAYTNWQAGEPSNTSNEDYVDLNVTTGKWNDANSVGVRRSIIEWNADDVLDATNALTYSIQSQTVAGAFTINSDTGAITVADGSLLDYETNSTHTITVRISDGTATYDEAFTVALIDMPYEVQQTIPLAAQDVDENSTLTFSSGNGNAITVTDENGATNSQIQVYLQVNNGTLTLSQTTGLSIPGGANGSSFMTIQGTESAINAALEGLMYTPDADYKGNDGLTVTTSMGAGLEGHYTFDGGNANDQSVGISQNGTLTGNATTIIDPVRGEVLSLDGNGDRVDVAGNMGQPANVTIAAWVNLAAADTQGATVLQMGGSLGLRLDNPSGNIVGFFNDGTQARSLSAATTVAGTGWRHVTYSFNDATNTAVIYLDGVAIATGTFTTSINYATSSFNIGGLSTDGYDFNGQMDDVRFYTRALSADEVSALAADHTEVTGNVAITVNPINNAPTFDVGTGIVTTDINPSGEAGYATAVQSDGRILVAGKSNNDFTIIRYNADGSLDASFGTNGVVINTASAASGPITGIMVQTDGKIVVAGHNAFGDVAVARYNSDGTIDTSFGTLGITTTAATGEITSATLQTDGKILVVGWERVGSFDEFFVLRYNTNGTLDTTFSGDGKLTTDIGVGNDRAQDVIVQSDGKIVVVGQSDNGSNNDFAVVRYNSDGTLDTSFDGDGKLTTAFSTSTDEAYEVMLQSDGKILVAGRSLIGGTNWDFAVVRYNTNGTLDTTFSGDGKANVGVGTSHDYGYAAVLQADGKIVIGGSGLNAANSEFALARLNSDGTLDTTFSGDGKLLIPLATSADTAYSLALTPDGDIIAAGVSSSNFMVARVNSDGTLDTSFGLVTTLDGNPTFTEGGSAVILDGNVQIFDQELSALDNFSGATLTLARSGGANSEDALAFDGINVTTSGSNVIVSGVTVGTYSFTGGQLSIAFGANATNARVNTLMQNIVYWNSSDMPPASVQIDWTFDDGDAGGALQATGSTTVNIVDVPNNADLVVPIAQTIDEDTPLIFSTAGGNAIVLDSGSTDDPTISVNLSVSSGTLTLAMTTGITFLNGTSNGSASLTIAGTETAINTALDGLQYLANVNFKGSDTLTLTTGSAAAAEANLYARWEFHGGMLTDGSGNGYDGTGVGDPALTNDSERGDVLTFDGVDRVTITNGALSLGNAVTIAAWVKLDAGQQDNVFLSIGDNFYVKLDQSNPSYSMGLAASSFSTNSLNAAHNIAGEGWHHVAATINDTPGAKQVVLYLNGVAIRSSTFSFSDIDWGVTGSPDITIGSLSDGSNGFVGSLDDVRVYDRVLSQTEINAVLGDHGFDNESVAISVQPVNDAPVLTPYGPTLPLVEDGGPYTATIASLLGSSVSDPDAGAVEGIAIYALTLAGGTLEYSIDGSNWNAVSGVSASNALLLRATDQMRFTPSTTNGGQTQINYHAWDQTSGVAGGTGNVTTNGGATAFSTATDNEITALHVTTPMTRRT
ncbi:MAG: LamG-like jellyroll fold domain-containing protein [Planctomycetaceae bacterium]